MAQESSLHRALVRILMCRAHSSTLKDAGIIGERKRLQK
jgi:hypothetical protein